MCQRRSEINQRPETCLVKLDFRLAALFLWMMLRLASLSSMALTNGNMAVASLASVDARSLRTALRAVLCW